MPEPQAKRPPPQPPREDPQADREAQRYAQPIASREMILQMLAAHDGPMDAQALAEKLALTEPRSEEHTSELQSLMRISYAVFCLKKKTIQEAKHIKLDT